MEVILPFTLPETNTAYENTICPGKYHQNCGFSMTMLVSGRVSRSFPKLSFHKAKENPLLIPFGCFSPPPSKC